MTPVQSWLAALCVVAAVFVVFSVADEVRYRRRIRGLEEANARLRAHRRGDLDWARIDAVIGRIAVDHPDARRDLAKLIDAIESALEAA